MVFFELVEPCLRSFQCTIMGLVAKWYIELYGGNYHTFHDLAMTFMNHFQLRVHYDLGIYPLLIFQQDKSMHISDHIQ